MRYLFILLFIPIILIAADSTTVDATKVDSSLINGSLNGIKETTKILDRVQKTYEDQSQKIATMQKDLKIILALLDSLGITDSTITDKDSTNVQRK